MKALYVEGSTIFHRLPADAKLAALAIFAVLLFFTRAPLLLGGALALSLGSYALLRQSWKDAVRPLRPIFLTILFVGVFHLLFTGHEEALVTVLRLTALMLLAATVTATTRIGDFIATVTKLVRPLERLGLARAEDIGLAVGLVVRFLPDILGRYDSIRDAHRARGLKVSALTVIGPMIVLTLRDADNIADAIDARGIRGQ